MIHFPHAKIKNLKKCSRLVILPDYQGLGLGIKFLDEIAKMYASDNFEFGITTSAKNVIEKLKKSDNWVLIRAGFSEGNKRSKFKMNVEVRKVKTYSFIFKK